MAQQKKIAIVTGASSGIGREFARQADARYGDIDELWLIARRGKRLEALAKQLDAPTRIFAVDLTDFESINILKKTLEAENPAVGLLINAAGMGVFSETRSQSADEINAMIDLNVRATAYLTSVVLPYIPAGGRILFMSSIAAFMPTPGVCVYAASKAFVQSFSEALYYELKPLGIVVTAVSPFWVDTDFFKTANQSGYVKHFMLMKPAADVVRHALLDSEHRRMTSICGPAVKALRLSMHLLPDKLLMKAWSMLK